MSYEMKLKPWVHQLKALDYLTVRNHGALYTDMGSGKTKVMIDLIMNRGFKVVLVVCPLKVCAVWEYQLGLHSDIEKNRVFNVSKLSTPDKVSRLSKEFTKARKSESTRIIIVNYDSVWLGAFGKYLLRKTVGIDCVICDESHRIKSPSSKCSKYLTKIGKLVKYKYLLTGTPLAENPIDVYAQYRFLDSTVFGTNFDNFKAEYENVDIMKTAKVGYVVLKKDKPYIHLDRLQKKMYSCAFKIDSTVELPPTTSIVTKFEMSPKCQQAYKELKKEGILEFSSGFIEVSNALTRIIREQQLTSGFAVIEGYTYSGETETITVDTSRQEALQELIEGINQDEPVVVFAKFKKDLDAIKSVSKSLGRKYSEVSGRADTLQEWKDGKAKVLGVQYKAGSEGIDLTEARYCIYYSLTHSLMLYAQSLKRTHRPGQEHPVTYYHLVATGKKMTTIDEEIMEALRRKKKVVDYVMEIRKDPN